jgi:hypothetical protein
VPCYRCGTRQVDPEAGKSSAWRRGVVREHQVLICPACHPSALADLTRCTRCGSAHLIRRLDQVECLDCRLIRDAEPELPDHESHHRDLSSRDPSSRDPSSRDPSAPPPGPAARAAGSAGSGGPGGPGSDLAAEVARALERLRDNRLPPRPRPAGPRGVPPAHASQRSLSSPGHSRVAIAFHDLWRKTALFPVVLSGFAGASCATCAEQCPNGETISGSRPRAASPSAHRPAHRPPGHRPPRQAPRVASRERTRRPVQLTPSHRSGPVTASYSAVGAIGLL